MSGKKNIVKRQPRQHVTVSIVVSKPEALLIADEIRDIALRASVTGPAWKALRDLSVACRDAGNRYMKEEPPHD